MPILVMRIPADNIPPHPLSCWIKEETKNSKKKKKINDGKYPFDIILIYSKKIILNGGQYIYIYINSKHVNLIYQNAEMDKNSSLLF